MNKHWVCVDLAGNMIGLYKGIGGFFIATTLNSVHFWTEKRDAVRYAKTNELDVKEFNYSLK